LASTFVEISELSGPGRVAFSAAVLELAPALATVPSDFEQPTARAIDNTSSNKQSFLVTPNILLVPLISASNVPSNPLITRYGLMAFISKAIRPKFSSVQIQYVIRTIASLP
jgi:hypothetical protein